VGVIDRRIAEFAAGQHDVLGDGDLLALGVGPRAIARRLADHRLHCLFRNAYAVGTPRVTQRGRWKAATTSYGHEALVSYRHGAALWDLMKPRGPIDVTVPRKQRGQPGIRLHVSRTLTAPDRTTIDAIPVTSLARTLLDLAEVVTPLELQRAYERAEELEILDVRALEELLQRSNGRRGVAALRSLLAYDPGAAAGAASELERLFLDLVREAGLPAPQTNVLVHGYLVDACWPEAGLVVELDGYEFHSDRTTFERDREKATLLKLAGLTFVAFTHRQVTRERLWVAATVEDLLADARRATAR
jgi:very-short-patch-repair endonuclease